MRKIMMTVLAAAILVPSAASAQSAREVRQGQREVQQDRRDVRQAVARGDYREARESRQELREDRQELREDWRDYRQSNRNAFRRDAYVGPRGYRYRPVNAGYQFQPAYYNSRYYVNDYARFRLPAPGRALRYVRYGNDVLLVNINNGRVVRVYNNFFWR